MHCAAKQQHTAEFTIHTSASEPVYCVHGCSPRQFPICQTSRSRHSSLCCCEVREVLWFRHYAPTSRCHRRCRLSRNTQVRHGPGILISDRFVQEAQAVLSRRPCPLKLDKMIILYTGLPLRTKHVGAVCTAVPMLAGSRSHRKRKQDSYAQKEKHRTN